MHKLILKKDRERSLLRRHPWIFSGAVERMDGNPAPGEVVAVHSREGGLLATAGYSPASQIRARVFSFEGEKIDQAFFEKRILAAVARR